MVASLHAQSYTAWKALWIGEEESESGNVKQVKADDSGPGAIQASLRAIYGRADVKEFVNDCDFVVKLDDDDVISADILERASHLDFDCYFDEYHTFYDIASGIIGQQKRPWIPSTAIHKKEHAFKMQREERPCDNLLDSLFYTDHAREWISYYRGRQIVHPQRSRPVYLRVLSPTSITAGARGKAVLTLADVDIDKYSAYLRQFGAWIPAKVAGFEKCLPLLHEVWPAFAGKPLEPIRGIPLKAKIKSLLGLG